MLKLLLILPLFYLISASSDIILKPIKEGANTVAIIFIHGNKLGPERYLPLFNQIQTKSNDSLWVAIPAFLGDVPVEELHPKVFEDMLTKLHTSGMPENTKIFLSGYSLGGYTSQVLAIKHQNEITGQILLGSYLLRAYHLTNTTFPVPTLTLSGELDGLTRVTRIIESFYFYSSYPHFTVIIPGMNHMNIASGKPTDSIIEKDIQSEINETTAHEELATRMIDYINMLLNHQTITPMLEYNLNQTKIFAQPYIQALDLEGSYHLFPPCDNSTNGRCQLGSPWSTHAQKIMSGLNDTVQFNVSDEFHVVYKPPEHMAHLDNNCSSVKPLTSCVLNIHTVTQNVYDHLDERDEGVTHSSAEEMRVKMISRQVLFQAADGKEHDFNQTDNQSLCGLINQYTLNWALENAGEKTKERYERIGKKMIIGNDIGPLNAGPLWIWTPLVRINTRESYE